MNAFANTLFTLILGWVRGLVSSLFALLTGEGTHGALTWLGDHWLSLAIFVIIVCTILDYLVWLVRWRPFLVWRTRLRMLGRRLHRNRIKDKAFNRGYTDSVLPRPQVDAAPQAPLVPMPAKAPLSSSRVAIDPRDVNAQMAYAPAKPIAAPPPKAQPYTQLMFEEEFEPRQKQLQKRHKRRTEKYRHGIAGAFYTLRNRINEFDDEHEEILDGLPPAVKKGKAFHEPVFPKRRQEDEQK